VKVNSNVIVAAIDKSAAPWLTVSKANGEVLSNKVALVETACIGRQLFFFIFIFNHHFITRPYIIHVSRTYGKAYK
jgi:hypothetical protein